MKKSVKITLIVVIVVVAALCLSIFIWNHTTKAAIEAIVKAEDGIMVTDASNTIRSKKLIGEFTETFPYTGLHVVFMPEPYTVQKGEKVAVCVTQKANDKYIICAKTEYNQKAYDAGYCSDSYAATAIVNPGESYIFLKDSNTWEDFSEIKNTLENLDGPTSFFTYDNFPIKLYASIAE